MLLGASGCGKTTALRMIAGLESVTSGRILIGDRDVTNVLPKYRDIAMVFQSYALYPHMTVFANIAYPLTVRGSAEGRDRGGGPGRRAAGAARGAARPLSRASSPAASASASRSPAPSIRRPAAFLMDEPLSNLDAKLRGHMRAELKHMQHELGITTIYVTHDQIEAMTLAHRVAVMDKGVLQQLDTPANIYNEPANLFVAGFIGSPPMNFLDGELADGRFSGPAGSFGTKSAARSLGAVAGVRPEDCRVTEPAAGKIVGEVYATELMGDHTLVTCRVDGGTITVKADKTFDRRDGEPIGVDFADAAPPVRQGLGRPPPVTSFDPRSRRVIAGPLGASGSALINPLDRRPNRLSGQLVADAVRPNRSPPRKFPAYRENNGQLFEFASEPLRRGWLSN